MGAANVAVCFNKDDAEVQPEASLAFLRHVEPLYQVWGGGGVGGWWGGGRWLMDRAGQCPTPCAQPLPGPCAPEPCAEPAAVPAAADAAAGAAEAAGGAAGRAGEGWGAAGRQAVLTPPRQPDRLTPPAGRGSLALDVQLCGWRGAALRRVRPVPPASRGLCRRRRC